MEFCHRPTFLRSALARDPFALGGIITPEDVLRLEEKFPTLFDKPPHPPTPKFEIPQGELASDDGDDDEDEEAEVKGKPVQVKKQVGGAKRDFKSALGNKGVPKKVIAVPKRKTAPVIGSKPVKSEIGLTQQKKTSEFHRKCTEKATLVTLATGQRKTIPVLATGSAAGRKLIRPAQSFSLEDLRATLRQVLQEENALKQSAGPHSLKSLPSPYTEDLVKKFLGWKMTKRGGQGQKNVTGGKIGTNVKKGVMLEKLSGKGDATSRMKAMTDTIAAYKDNTPIITTRATKKASAEDILVSPVKISNHRIIPRIKSAPGFIRGAQELPLQPNYQKKRMMLSIASRDHKVNEEKKAKDRSGILNGCGERGASSAIDGKVKVESRRKHVRWEEDIDDEEVESSEDEGDKLDEDVQEMNRHRNTDRGRTGIATSHSVSSQNEGQALKRPEMKGAPIFLKSTKKPVSRQLTSESAFEGNDRFKVGSSYQHLLDARSEGSHYKLKRFLRKQDAPCNFYTKQLQRERKEQKERRTGQNGNFIGMESSSDPSGNSDRKLKEMGTRAKEETNKILRQMAHELVYMEVLHQISELKREQKNAEKDERRKEILKPSTSPSTSTSHCQREHTNGPINMPNFVPTTTTEHEDESESGSRGNKKQHHESKSSSEIILKTPELTPPPNLANKRHDGKVSSPRVENVSLHTPELSPSSRRLIAAIKERKELEKRLLESPPKQKHQHQFDTDCSEMSDFVFSEPSRKAEKFRQNTPPQVKKESVKLGTPELSGSQEHTPKSSRAVEDQNTASAGQGDKSQGKNGSTLSDVQSTFLETPRASQGSGHHSAPKSDAAFHKPENSGKSTTSKYSDDFTPEKGALPAAHSDPARTAGHKNVQKGSQSENDFVSEPGFSAHGSDGDPPDNLNTSGETVIDLISEGEFIGTAYRSPGELSWHQERFRPRRQPTLVSNQSEASSSRQHKNSSSYEHQLSFSGSTVEQDEDGSISILSFGAQIAPENDGVHGVSVGEHVRS